MRAEAQVREPAVLRQSPVLLEFRVGGLEVLKVRFPDQRCQQRVHFQPPPVTGSSCQQSVSASLPGDSDARSGLGTTGRKYLMETGEV